MKLDDSQPSVSPWGTIQSVETIVPGILFCSTASHGGYFVCSELNTRIPEIFKLATTCAAGLHGWYEEDSDWAFVIVCFPELFEKDRYIKARRILKRTHPAEWNAYVVMSFDKSD
jgi:hypothetical protein